jgi:hypothetical protein
MNPVQKALALRKSLPLKARVPSTAFIRRLRRPQEILRCIEKYVTNKGVLYEARRHYVVALCAAYEAYWRDFFKLMIDSHHFSHSHIQRLRQQRFTFSDLHQIIGNKLTLGELITCSYTFQSTDILNQVCQEVFDLDFFAEFAKFKFRIEPVYKKSKMKPTVLEGSKYLRCRANIDRGFQIRHDTVHDTGYRYQPSASSLIHLEGNIHTFNLFGSIVLESRIDEMYPESNKS